MPRAMSGDRLLRMPMLLGALLLALPILALPMTLRGAEEVDDLLPYIPGSANAVSLIRIQELIHTPRGMREGWAKSGAVKALAGVEHLPLNVPFVVRGAHLVSGENSRGWSMSLVPWPKDASMVNLAQHEKGEVDMIHGTAAVKSPSLGYLVRLQPDTLGIINPADRQDVARWVRFAKLNSQPRISDYLRNAIDLHSSHVVLAFDLEEMMQPETVKLYLMNSPVLKKLAVNIEPFSEWLSGLRGIQLNAVVDDKIAAELRFDFATEVGQYAETFRQVFTEFMAERGVPIIELADATPIREGKTFRLRMTLSDESLGGLMSTLPFPNSSGASPASAQKVPAVNGVNNAVNPVKAGQAPVDLISTANYYRAVMQLLDELENLNSRATDYIKAAVWNDNYATKIENLPVNGVDHDLVQFASGAANNLRVLASSLRGVPTKVGALNAAVTSQVQGALYGLAYDPWYGYQYVPAGGDYVYGSSNVSAVREKQATVIAKGSDERMKLWNLLLGERSSIRQKMIERYPSLTESAVKK